MVSFLDDSVSSATTLELKNGEYICTTNPNRIPARGSGNFSIIGNKTTFQDVNYWTADFDWNSILNGEYDYVFDGKELKISAKRSGVANYEYDLEKQ